MNLHDERRLYQRVSGKFNVRLTRQTPDALDVNIGKCVNISANGLLVNLNKEASGEITQGSFFSRERVTRQPLLLQPGDQIGITFLKPNTFEMLSSVGKVVRVEEIDNHNYLAGIALHELSIPEMDGLNYHIMSSVEGMPRQE